MFARGSVGVGGRGGYRRTRIEKDCCKSCREAETVSTVGFINIVVTGCGIATLERLDNLPDPHLLCPQERNFSKESVTPEPELHQN